MGRPAGGPRAETPSSPSWLSSPRPGLLHPPSLRLLSFLRPRMLVFSEVSPFTPSLPLLLSCSLSFFSFLRSDSHFRNCSLTAGDVPLIIPVAPPAPPPRSLPSTSWHLPGSSPWASCGQRRASTPGPENSGPLPASLLTPLGQWWQWPWDTFPCPLGPPLPASGAEMSGCEVQPSGVVSKPRRRVRMHSCSSHRI